MQMPIVVGVILAIIFLVAFSEWFYHMVAGWGEIVIDDVYFKYRIAGVTLFSFVIISMTFFGMAIVTECPNEQREGPFAGLRCEEYLKIKAGTEKLFPQKPEEAETVPY
ncbi:TPA: hypothetical protein DIU27_03285 [Candidatus Collierbacteria bacterium]|uniref:Uncharacterized protein n=1 Tax=Candidatus Collierbacteria bacterium GW2011_GWB2_44_22 TaxID=1618387 RepID=A0A0G1KWC7_9BACT|nr:MAG: hypothetical protein UW31_C0001G0019 [Candidatus Collierbacteria bacterium GW2011_GWA2_44_13]KKT49718.1 MAG: hypothetical protein UW42_C0031G0010 [Candidatus Collierbacteria bacterium GW2011_GWB1_44_197]KKT52214.1 MAG: hypothetical protein UW44_C0003G0057 [Candidatus Collierbacteria bacterium GW2011_GWB2_44_22]KKT62421.1 MAG: hypothetical protein UW56_C0007G0029 [Candidatus Collierbacteria bacterium GW2011_GWD1_44_27]KKT66843.1 MAG: hypothetical protein UW58_C0002G0028 [Candidatus Colli